MLFFEVLYHIFYTSFTGIIFMGCYTMRKSNDIRHCSAGNASHIVVLKDVVLCDAG